jgi:hypothetical protein
VRAEAVEDQLRLAEFDVLRPLEWIAKQCIDGAYPVDLEMPIPLDFYEAVRWRAAKDERDP